MRVLVVDDEQPLREALERALRVEHYEVETAESGAQALERMKSGGHGIDAVVLDVLMPGVDGLEVCRHLRNSGDKTPVLMLTARVEVEDRVAGLDAGADDYLVKPFSLGELLARMRVALRHRGTTARPAVTRWHHESLDVDLAAHRVTLDGADVHLTPTEFKLLARLVRSAGQVVTHRQLLADVWGPECTEQTHYLRLYMAQLRAKLEADPADPRLLLTEPGVGYRVIDAGD
jgi:two-component system KDP operon response regulator KdpE